MDSEDKQRISLYLDKETVIKMDEAIKKYDYRSRNDFVSFAVDNLIADKLLDENDTVISEKLSKAIAEMSEKQTLQIAKSMFRYRTHWRNRYAGEMHTGICGQGKRVY